MGAYKPNPKNLFTQFFILESYELKINSNMYSSGKKSVVFCFALLLPQILVDFQNQGADFKSASPDVFKTLLTCAI